MNECAPGALVSYGDMKLVIANTADWVDDIGMPIQDVPHRIKSLLWEKYQCPTNREVRQLKTDNASSFRQNELSVPGVLFPSWMYCTKCGQMERLPWLSKDRASAPTHERFPIKCSSSSCQARMAFAPFVMIHQNGWQDDLPWGFIAHCDARNDEQKSCKQRKNLELLRNKEGKEVVRCKDCRSETQTSGLRNPDFLKGKISKMNEQPWKRKVQEDLHGTAPIIVDLSDGRIHFPTIISAVDIPPESRKDPGNLEARIRAHQDFDRIEGYKTTFPTRFAKEVAKLAGQFNTTAEAVRQVFESPEAIQSPSECHSQKDIFRAEYSALLTPLEDLRPDERFIPRHRTEEWKRLCLTSENRDCRMIDRLVTLERLREVQVFCGFSRVSQQGTLIETDAKSWSLGCELFGEGLFFSLDTALLEAWEKKDAVRERVAEIERRLNNSEFEHRADLFFLEDAEIDANVGARVVRLRPRFVLLHTLSHLIAKELEFHCGYPLSSLKERLYASLPKNGNAAGVLIYVTAADEYGTLGGLIECSRAEIFARIFRDALQKAERCSLDPVCQEHLGQGPDLLNLAACHNCCLVPETTCQFGNLFLDRQLLVHKDYGFLAFMKRQ